MSSDISTLLEPIEIDGIKTRRKGPLYVAEMQIVDVRAGIKDTDHRSTAKSSIELFSKGNGETTFEGVLHDGRKVKTWKHYLNVPEAIDDEEPVAYAMRLLRWGRSEKSGLPQEGEIIPVLYFSNEGGVPRNYGRKGRRVSAGWEGTNVISRRGPETDPYEYPNGTEATLDSAITYFLGESSSAKEAYEQLERPNFEWLKVRSANRRYAAEITSYPRDTPEELGEFVRRYVLGKNADEFDQLSHQPWVVHFLALCAILEAEILAPPAMDVEEYYASNFPDVLGSFLVKKLRVLPPAASQADVLYAFQTSRGDAMSKIKVSESVPTVKGSYGGGERRRIQTYG